MKINYVLIDYENVQVKSLTLLNGDQFRVRVFLGKSNTKIHSKLAIAMQKLGNRAEYIMLESSGSNALDFHIAYYLGVLAAADPGAMFHIISKDTGFDPLVKHLNSRSVLAARSMSIEAMSCFDSSAARESSVSPLKQRNVAPSAKVKGKFSPAQEDQIKAVIENLNNRKSNRPATMKTLLNIIHAKIGKERPLAEAETMREELVARKYVLVSGQKVTYKLPKAD